MLQLALILSVLGSPLAVLTMVGARHRGTRLPLALLAGLAFPITWAVWYLRDEHPYARHG